MLWTNFLIVFHKEGSKTLRLFLRPPSPQAPMLLKFLRLLGSYVPKAPRLPRLPGTYTPKSPLCPRLVCSERNFLNVLFLMHVHKQLTLGSFRMICSLMTIPNMPMLLKPS